METRELLTLLTEIPAPTGREEKRAAFVKKQLESYGYSPVTDEAGNVVVERKVSLADEGFVLFTAHLDTVFPDTEIKVIADEKGLHAPGIGDDTCNVVLLLKAMERLARCELGTQVKNAIFAFDTGEEGLGNLKGIRQILKSYKGKIKACIAFDLTPEKLVVHHVGSRRFRVCIKTKGGHSLSDFGNTNAIAVAAKMIRKIYQIQVPSAFKTTYNVGTISGGTGINVIADEADFTCEIRSESREAMDTVENQFMEIFEEGAATDDVEVDVKLIGERPVGVEVDEKVKQELIRISQECIKESFLIEPELAFGSTDCNAVEAEGIPAVSFGGYLGGGTHAKNEWITYDYENAGNKLFSEVLRKILT